MPGIRFFKFLYFLVILGFLLLTSQSLSAQTDEEKITQLRVQIEALERQAQQYRSTIAQTKEQANTLNAQINDLKLQINRLETELALTGKKIDKTSIEITGVKNNIYDTEQNIKSQKESVGEMLMFLHRRDKESLVGILSKSKSISDYFNQEEYALMINNQLISLIEDLKDHQDQLSKQKTSLESKKVELESLKNQESAQKISLAGVKNDKTTLLAQTKGQEAQYQKMLTQVEIQESEFFSQLRELETHVIQGGLYIVHVTTGSLPKKRTKLFQWPEDIKRITQNYGCTRYARCGRSRGAYGGAPHNGVDIAAGFGSSIKAIGDGKIIANGRNDGWGNWVAIQHPDQYNLVSIYAHMSALSFLQVGTQVKAGDVIGYEGNTGNTEGSHLHLSLYKEFFTYVNEKKNGQLYFNYFEGTINPLDYL